MCTGCRREAEHYRSLHPPVAEEAALASGNDAPMVRRRRPWWETHETTVMVKYTKPVDFQADATAAEEHGWRPVAADSYDGRAVGSIGTPALLIALRTLGSITVVWERPTPAPPGPAMDADPVETLRQLKEMLDLQLIAEHDYEEKKAEVLARM